MTCRCDQRGELLPTSQKGTELLHEHQLRHHSIQVPPINYRLPLVTPETLHVKPVFDYARGPGRPYLSCASAHADDVPDYCHWDISQVGQWLSQVGYGRYQHTFANLALDGQKLPTVDAHELRRMGVKKWQDCLGLADVISQLTGRRVQLRPEDYKYKIYPYYPALYMGEQDPVFPAYQVAQTAPPLDRRPEQERVYRHIYNAAGDRFYYFDSQRPPSLI